MVEWESGRPIRLKLFMAMEVFFCHVLRILTSDLDGVKNKHSLGEEERSCVIAMFVIIMSAEPTCWTDFVI